MGSALRAHHGILIRKVPIGLLSEYEYDLYYPEVSSLMYFEGTNAANDFIDETDKIWSASGSAQTVSAQVKYGITSGYFNGTTDHISVTDHAGLSMGTKDFTWEAWLYVDSAVAAWARIFENETFNVTGGWHLSFNGSDSAGVRRLGYQVGLNGGGGARIDTNNPFPVNTWAHIAICRINSVTAMYVNGVKQTATLSDSNNYTSQKGRIGSTLGTASNFYKGYIDDCRLTKGVGRYFENFTPPTKSPLASNGWDDNFASVSSLLHCDGTNGSTSIIDITGKKWTVNGNAQITTSQFKFGGASLTLDGSGDYLSTPHHANLSLISGDFTIEGWVRMTATPGANNTILNKDGVSGTSYPQYDINITTGMKLSAFLGNGNGTSPSGTTYTGTTTLSLSTWYHFAVVKTGSICKGFLNGKEEWSATAATMYEGSKPLLIGYQDSVSGSYLNGQLDNIRITKGIARYTKNFTPLNAPFPNAITADDKMHLVSSLLHGEGADGSTTFTDSTGKIWTASGNAQIDTAQFKYGTSSILLDGTGDYISTPSHSDFAFGTSDFTIEFNTRFNAHSTVMTWLGTYNGTNGFTLQRRSDTNTIRMYNGATQIIDVSWTPTDNIWYHITVCRKGTDLRIFVDGVQIGTTATSSHDIIQGQDFNIGRQVNTNNEFFNGWMDEIRITKGFARYTANFVPPIKPHCDIGYNDPYKAFTKCLLPFEEVDASTTFADLSGKTWTAFGNAQIDTAQQKFGTASGLFDGAGDYISTPDSADLYFGSSDFTVEGWIRTNGAVSSTACFVGQWASGNLQFTVGCASTNRAYFSLSTNGTSGTELIGANNSVPTSTWCHFAAVRHGSTHYYYIDGVSVASGAISGALYNSTTAITIGSNASSQAFNGWIDDVRITNGICRYPSGTTFTPPALPFTIY